MSKSFIALIVLNSVVIGFLTYLQLGPLNLWRKIFSPSGNISWIWLLANIGILGLLLIFIITSVSIYVKSNSLKQIEHKPSIPFTIGYLHARAMWWTISELIFCLNSKHKDILSNKLLQNERKLYPQKCINKIKALANRLGWSWDDYVSKLNLLIGEAFDMIANFSRNEISPNDHQSLKNLIDQLSEQSRELILQAGKQGNISEIEMIFIGHQVGKIDQMILSGDRYYSVDKVVPSCRIFLKAMFEKITTQEIQPILLEFPGIESRLDSIGRQEIRNFISRLKRTFLYNEDPLEKELG